MAFSVRRLGADDVAVYRDIRLEGLRLDPISFASTLDEEAAMPDDDFRGRLARNFTFGVFDGVELVGMATYYIEAGTKTEHRGHVVGVYVRPGARGTGAATLLLETLMASASERLAFLYLVVNQANGRARRFYERLGFTTYGRDPGGLMVDGVLHEDNLMMLALKAQRKATQ
jgi:ribosomal protein S18 acetylase RimI-like enzyme